MSAEGNYPIRHYMCPRPRKSRSVSIGLDAFTCCSRADRHIASEGPQGSVAGLDEEAASWFQGRPKERVLLLLLVLSELLVMLHLSSPLSAECHWGAACL